MTRTLTDLPDGIQHIALSFSGGGFRAASFALGCASYLQATPYQEGPLLNKVKYISSTSGGTITNLTIAAFLRKGESFETIYHHLLTQIDGTKLLDRAIEILKDEKCWVNRRDKSRNLINAFAMVYDEQLFKGAQFDLLFQKPDHDLFFIEEICANTAELDNGLNFRFGTRGEIGNTYLKCEKGAEHLTAVRKIRLADILASSSCFPGGFEPIMYPRDFASTEVSMQELSNAFEQSDVYNNPAASTTKKEISFGFMDGGIDDNQGIYAFLKAEDRKSNYEFDLYLPCDVTSNYLENPFEFPRPDASGALGRTPNELLRNLKRLGIIYLVAIALTGMTAAILFLWTSFHNSAAFLLGIFAVNLAIILVLRLGWSMLQNKLQGNASGTWAIVFKKHAAVFLDIPLHNLLAMLAARASSVFLLVGTIFLKKIRRISYDYLYSEKSRQVYSALIKSHNDQPSTQAIEPGVLWNDHLGMTALHQLATKNRFMLLKEIKSEPWDFETATVNGHLLKDFMQPSAALRAHVDNAAQMDTTLWFDQNHVQAGMLESIVIAGQATVCFNLLRIRLRFASASANWDELLERLAADWAKFCEQPNWLYEGYKIKTGNENVL